MRVVSIYVKSIRRIKLLPSWQWVLFGTLHDILGYYSWVLRETSKDQRKFLLGR